MAQRLSNTDKSVRVVMNYTDFKVGVDTEPDNNGCMWVEIRTMRPQLNSNFDMSRDCVVALRDACNEFLRKV